MNFNQIDRRQALVALGALGGSLGLGCAATVAPKAAADAHAAPPAKSPMGVLPWPYKTLDPDVVGQRGYDSYAKGHCMYGSFEAIVGSVADQLGAPYDTFPYGMFVYGAGGINGWGTICGCLNGSAAAIQMLSPNPEPVIDELFRWYENTALPDFDPKGIKFASVRSVASSPLCHPSIAKWCEKSSKKSYSPERKDRCGVLTAAVARHAAFLLNEQAAGRFAKASPLDPRTQKCSSCHEKGGEVENVRAKQICESCHPDPVLEQRGHQKL